MLNYKASRIRRKRSALPFAFRAHSVLAEKRNGSEETLESLRLMMVRDQTAEIVGMMAESWEARSCVRMLLSDDHVGVPAIAADVLREAAVAGLDIGFAERELAEATYDKYAKANAAGALAFLYLRNGMVSRLHALLERKDPAVREAAGAACLEGCPVRLTS